jgi:hypothetical protein
MISTRTTSDKKSPIARSEDLKAIQRVLNNRRSAQASRERKRRYLSELEMNRSHLINEAQALRQRIKQLEADKAALAHQVAQLRDERIKVIGISNDEEFCDSLPASNPMMIKEPATQMGYSRTASHPSVFELPFLSGPASFTLPMPTPISSLLKTTSTTHTTTLPSRFLKTLPANRRQSVTLTRRSSSPATCSFWNSWRPSKAHHRYHHRRYHCSKKNI